jgi:hypothetical protein
LINYTKRETERENTEREREREERREKGRWFYTLGDNETKRETIEQRKK